jgi:hypothetical protein
LRLIQPGIELLIVNPQRQYSLPKLIRHANPPSFSRLPPKQPRP